jgi:hypothetical protein
MSTITIVMERQKCTVSQMRQRLARMLAHLPGDLDVSFTFGATLENYQTPTTVSVGELARPEND